MKLIISTITNIAISTVVISIIFSFSAIQSANAHGGGLDGNGGHNCNTGPCAGSYHYHYGGDKTTEYSQPEGYVAPAVVTPPKQVVTTKTETETKAIEFKTIEKDDPTLAKGETKIEQEGVNGEKEITYTVTYIDGSQSNREKSGEKVTKEPVDKIVLIGTKQPVSEEEKPEETEDAADAAGTAIVLGGLGYVGYRKFKKKKS